MRISPTQARQLARRKDYERRSAGFLPPMCERDGLLLRIEVAFNEALLKNHAHTLARHLTLEARQARQAVVDAVRLARSRGPARRWPERKTWLEVQAWKPSHRTDAINLLDGLADAIKEALGIDDRWFAVRRLDWSLDPTDPRVLVLIEADAWADQSVCAKCGRIYEEQTKGRRCEECRRKGGL